MNNKAFTLVELLAIISLLVIVFLVSFPNFISIARKDKSNEITIIMKNLCLAGETYIYSNIGETVDGENITISSGNTITISSGVTITIRVSKLISEGLVEASTNETSIDNAILIYTVNSNKELSCSYEEE